MLFNKWLLSPVLSLLVAVPVLAQVNWIEVGKDSEGGIIRINPEMNVSGATNSVVMYELLIELNPPVNGMYGLRNQVLAQCGSKAYALSSTEALNQQGRVIDSRNIPYPEMNWIAPINDVYGKAFQMACEGR